MGTQITFTFTKDTRLVNAVDILRLITLRCTQSQPRYFPGPIPGLGKTATQAHDAQSPVLFLHPLFYLKANFQRNMTYTVTLQPSINTRDVILAFQLYRVVVLYGYHGFNL